MEENISNSTVVRRGKRRVRVFDTTLRDGEQTPGVALTLEKKVEIAKALAALGVDVIEAGFPIVSDGEMAAVKAINRLGLGSQVCALSRPERPDIAALVECDISFAHQFIATSDLHLKYKLKVTRERAIEMTVDGVEYARKHGMKVAFSAEDSTRSDRNFLVKVLKSAVDAGAERIGLADTVGVSTPENFSDLVKFVTSQIRNVPLDVHCHNDYGLAVANTLAGISAGADEAQVTVNGIGERAGNASLEEFVMAVTRLYDCETGINTRLLYPISRLISKMTGVLVQPNKAIVGENAFGHESGIHTHGVINLPATYEPMEPELVGGSRRIQAGKHAGSHGVSAQLQNLGIEASPDQVKAILQRVKVLGDQGKSVTDVELDGIAREVMGLARQDPFLKITGLSVVTGMNMMPTASVQLKIGGEEQTMTAAETGTGPVNAAIRAIQTVSDKFAKVRLKEYRVEAFTGGTSAEVEVRVKIEDEEGRVSSASSTGTDIVVTSVDAMINGINEVILQKFRSPRKQTQVATP